MSDISATPRRRQKRRVVMHHPRLGKETRLRQREVHLWKKRGWVEGPLPEGNGDSSDAPAGDSSDAPAGDPGATPSPGAKAPSTTTRGKRGN